MQMQVYIRVKIIINYKRIQAAIIVEFRQSNEQRGRLGTVLVAWDLDSATKLLEEKMEKLFEARDNVERSIFEKEMNPNLQRTDQVKGWLEGVDSLRSRAAEFSSKTKSRSPVAKNIETEAAELIAEVHLFDEQQKGFNHINLVVEVRPSLVGVQA